MISAVDPQRSGLKEAFFQNRFPEPKDEPLFRSEESKRGEGSPDASSAQQPASSRVDFSQAMRHAEQAHSAPKEEQPQRKTDNKAASGTEDERNSEDAFEALKVKAQYNALFW